MKRKCGLVLSLALIACFAGNGKASTDTMEGQREESMTLFVNEQEIPVIWEEMPQFRNYLQKRK